MHSCSRWVELSESLLFHANLAHKGSIACEFDFLNNTSSGPFVIGCGNEDSIKALNDFKTYFERTPVYATPLCKHIRNVTKKIERKASELRRNNQVACVIIATDGESTDGDVADVLRPLKYLPVLIIIRLCTNEERIVEYWNNIDKQLQLHIDVLDDLKGEAEEVQKNNPWLTYGEPLHRMREFGLTIKELDMLDEKKLTFTAMKKVTSLM
jgi:hypothetical protein